MTTRQRMGLMLALPIVTPLFSVAQNSPAGDPPAATPAAKSVRIFYSGRMLGYLREDRKGDPLSLSVLARDFMAQYQGACAKPPCVLLGMGDNLAPKFESRLQDDQKTFKSRNNSSTNFEDDNVGRFLGYAKFTALVPGKEDFYFGAFRLWKIADTLNRSKQKDGVEGPFLADNLILHHVDHTEREPWDDYKPERSGKVKKFVDHADWVSSSFGGNALPWLSELTFTFDPPLTQVQFQGLQGRRCRAVRNPDDIDPSAKSCAPWIASNKGLQGDSIAKVSFVRNASDPEQIPGKDYGFCMNNPSSGKPPYCLKFHVETPMFRTPYVIAKGSQNNADVAIFAVVDPEIHSYIPKLSVGWDVLDHSGKLLEASALDSPGTWLPQRIEIAAFSPEQGLEQALDSFALYHPRFSGAKVLMAQLPYAAADELARHLTAADGTGPAFDLVIARSDLAHQTWSQTITLHQVAEANRPRFVAVPPPAWNYREERAQVPLGSVTITRNNQDITAEFSTYSGCSRQLGAEVPPPSAAWNELSTQLRSSSVKGHYASCYPNSGGKHVCLKDDDLRAKDDHLRACLLEFASCAMLQGNAGFDTEGSDVALLQLRDAFVPTSSEARSTHLAHVPTVQSILDRIFWKDDLLTHANFSGSQLKRLIKQSGALEKEETNLLIAQRDTTDRALQRAGLVEGDRPKPGSQDPSMYSHLQELEDSSLYRVAASSYLSTGETGYPEFLSPAEGKVDFFQRGASGDKTGVRISVLVCEALKDGAATGQASLYQCDPPKAPKAGTVSEKDYAVSEADTKAIAGLLIYDDRQQMGTWTYLEDQVAELAVRRDPFKGKGSQGSQRQVQNYPYLDVNLEKFAIAGSLNTALASLAETAQFKGVLESEISQATKSEFSWDTKLRILDRRGRFDIGAALDEEFDKSIQGSSPTWSRNRFAIGPVFQYSLTDPRITPRALLALHFDFTRQITNTALTLSGADSSGNFTLPLASPHGFQSKLGFRYESGDSYFEAGGLYTRNYRVLSEVADLPDGAVCDLSRDISLSDCVGQIVFPPDSAAPTLHYSTFDQGGVYWDGKLSLEVFKGRWSYEFTTRGNYYPHSDTVSALTRLDATVGNNLKFPLFGNFSLVPKAEWRFFQNQGTLDFLKRINTSVALTYSFHKDSRVGLGHAMLHKSSSGSE